MAYEVTVKDNNGKVFTTDKFMGAFMLKDEDKDGSLDILFSISNLTPKNILVLIRELEERIGVALAEAAATPERVIH
jgi:hypothetical protein